MTFLAPRLFAGTTRRRPALLIALSAVLLALLVGLASPAWAQSSATSLGGAPRKFPLQAERGVLVVGIAPEVTLNGHADRLSPGARIFDERNLLILPGQVRDQKLIVNYVREARGDQPLHQVWILTPDEIRQKLPTMPERSWWQLW